MFIGEKLKELREHKRLSQGDIEKRTGLLRCYISEGPQPGLAEMARRLSIRISQARIPQPPPQALNVGAVAHAVMWISERLDFATASSYARGSTSHLVFG
jgi:transcriptional regulator with XRE-family HTH domain